MRTIPQSAGRWICVGLALICLIALVPATALADTDLDVGGQAHIAYANGDAVRLRYGPGYSNDVLDMIPEGATVDVLDGPFWAADDSVWYKVDINGEDGYVDATYLAAGAGSGASADTSSASSDSSDTSASSGASDDGSNGATNYTTDALNLRDGPSYDNGIILTMPAGAAVTRTGQSANGFSSISYNGTDGWAVTDYLSADAPASSDTSSAQSSSSGESQGQQMVDFAMQYLGYPYVWATHGPDTFDCSGFTYWVALNVLGIDIGTGTAGQISEGTPVDESNLQAGDLVFFQNTGEAGISHVGIYIGGGQFIHAENPSTGVVISNLSDPYYTEHYYGAIRLT